MAKGIKTEWTEEMLHRMKFEFKYAYNKQLAIDLGVSWRTLVRKAREMGLEKEEGFLEKRKQHIQYLARAKRGPNATKGMKGWCIPNSEATRFKPGNISPMTTSQKTRDKVSRSRLKTIEEEKYRIREGIDQITKLKLKV
ncbi:hypothetical protein [Mangrovibacterium sp.]|uniref:hypothetical protein n=1 Tax=Mangrovibacterium sp. TaxID=1961364 RepID=UPI003566D9ED